MLLYFITKDHCFKDGNKRTAFISVFVFLQQNGYELAFSNDEVEKFVCEIVKSKINKTSEIDKYIKMIAVKVKENVQKID